MCKRALGTLLCLCMFCCLLPITVSAAEQTYTVTFDANGGSGGMDSQTAVAEEETALAGNQYTRDGYWFVGWNTAADGTGTAYADGASVTLAASLTLYAQWEQNGTAIGSGEDGARIYKATNGDVFLGGDYIELGLRPSGVFGTQAYAPTEGSVVFHPTHNGRIGLRSNGSLKWSAGLATGDDQTVDFFLPGTIDEGWLVGWTTTAGGSAEVKGGVQGYGSTYSAYGVVSGAAADALVTASQGKETLTATTTARVSDTVNVEQQISFDVTAKYFTTTVTLTNCGSETLYDLSYIRAFDPDQRAGLTQSRTDNHFHKDGDGNVWVVAFGNNSRNVRAIHVPSDFNADVKNNDAAITPFVFFAQAPAVDAGYTVQAINTCVGWSVQNYSRFYRGAHKYQSGDLLYGTHYYEDQGIGLEFLIASLGVGECVTFSWISSLDTNIVSTIENIQREISAKASALDSATGCIELELGAAVNDADKFVVKNNGVALAQGVDYRLTGTDTTTPVIQFETSAGLNCISEVTIEIQGVGSPIAVTNNIPHTWGDTLSNQGRTIDIDCTVAGCTASGGSITLVAPAGDVIYNGDTWEASLTGTDSLVDGITVPAITYTGQRAGAKPVNAGTYTACVTLGQSTAYVTYAVARASGSLVTTPTVTTAIPYGSPLSAATLSDPVWAWVDATMIPASSGEYNACLAVDDTNYDYSGIDGYDAQMHAIVRGVRVQVNRAILTVTAKNKAVAVGQPVPALTESDYTVNGLIHSDTLAGIGLTVSIAYASQPDLSQPGFTDIVVSGTGTPESYLVNYINGVLTVGSAPAITSTSLPAGTAGVAYSLDLATTGDGPFTWDVVNGSLPDGLSLLGGTICGTPTVAGTYSFVVQVANGVGSDTRELSITIAPAPAPAAPEIATTSLPGATVGVAYSQGLVTTGDGPFAWDVVNGSLPNGLILSGNTICGTPAAAGTYTFVIQATNDGGSDSIELTLEVADVFLDPCYFVEVQTTDGGAVRANGSWFWQGEMVTVTVVPENGCVLIGLTVVDSRGREICLTEKDQGKYTFQMPACKVTVTASFHRCPSLDYPDVDTSRWYHECIDYVLDHDLMDGIVDGVFEPDGIATRAMLVVAIWRSEGSCSVDYEMSYTDLKEDAPYAEAVRWATSVGIVEGFPDGSFRGDEAITREQMAAVFYRYEKFRGEGYTGDWCYELPYADADAVGAWAYEAVCWNTHMGVVHGDGIRFDPKGTATRAHVAQLLMNYLEQ